MGSNNEQADNIEIWRKYTNLISDQLKDPTSVRALFEQKLKHSQTMSTATKIDFLLENASFEEIQSNALRARKIYEQLDTEIAPGLVKARVARINFEKRQGNNDKARELYFESFTRALEKNDYLAVTYIATQYARFLAHKCNDKAGALKVFSQSLEKPACANKVLYLSYMNMARTDSSLIKSIFDKAISQLEPIPEKRQDLKEICHYFLLYLEEEAQDAAQIHSLRSKLADKNLSSSHEVMQRIKTQIGH